MKILRRKALLSSSVFYFIPFRQSNLNFLLFFSSFFSKLSKTSNQYQFINWRAGSSEALLEEKKRRDSIISMKSQDFRGRRLG